MYPRKFCATKFINLHKRKSCTATLGPASLASQNAPFDHVTSTQLYAGNLNLDLALQIDPLNEGATNNIWTVHPVLITVSVRER